MLGKAVERRIVGEAGRVSARTSFSVLFLMVMPIGCAFGML